MMRDPDDVALGRTDSESLEQVFERRLSRREALGRLAAAGALASGIASPSATQAADDVMSETVSPARPELDFTELPLGLNQSHAVAPGYEAQVVLSWGDPILPGAPPFDPANQSAEAQLQQFGYNNDFVAFMPLPLGSKSGDHGLLCVNHEYTNPWLMFSGLTAMTYEMMATAEQVRIEMAAMGCSIVEVRRTSLGWQPVIGEYNRRLSTLETPMKVSGPAAGHSWLKTSADPEGRTVIGTINNCAGGVTPWGTVLTAEENFNLYFGGTPPSDDVDFAVERNKSFEGYGVGSTNGSAWYRHDKRFDLSHEPNEANRFGWIVEYDPYDPKSTPIKRTALGRLKHEGATPVVCSDDRVVVYTGDDQTGEYLYKFVTSGKYNRKNRKANFGLLDEGTLYVAKFEEEGTLRWLPLRYGEGPLTEANGFANQGDVVIKARQAADALQATPMDRPEDVEVDPKTGRVYVMLTNNIHRGESQDMPVNPANPRPANVHGHIIEILPPGPDGQRDHSALTARWDLFLQGGNPIDPKVEAQYGAISPDGWLSCPDNAAFDSQGRMWIATDGAQKSSNIADGIWATQIDGEGRALTRHFFHGPTGCEICGPFFAPDDKTLFVSIQHPGEDDGSTFDNPSTRWPHFDEKLPPRPSVIAIIAQDGGRIGGS